jgi:serine-type D-Ala-D-Ala endopeptidase (penicillin-binding protein 7)
MPSSHAPRRFWAFALACSLIGTAPALANGHVHSHTRGRPHAKAHGHPHRQSHRQTSATTPTLKSSAVYVVDETNSAVVLSRQSDVALPIASITKLMTALVVLDAAQPMGETLSITDEDRGGAKTVTSRLEVGTTLSRADLMHLALMSSENRAAHALARNYPGGESACVQAMNAKARALGMKSAQFVDPTGLSSDNVASSEDLAKLVRAAARNAKIQEYSTDTSYTVPVRRHLVEFRTTDSLVRNPTWNIIVQKTGYISEAGRCLVMKTIFQGRSVIIVLLDSAGKYTRVADAVRIRKWMESGASAPPTRIAMVTGSSGPT